MREFLEAGHVDRSSWFGTDDMLPDGLTKGSVEREALIRCCYARVWRIRNEPAEYNHFDQLKADEDE